MTTRPEQILENNLVKQLTSLEYINSTDLGIVFGAGLELDISKSSLLLDIRYTLGLTKIRDYEDTSEKNAVISLMIGYIF